MNNNARYDRSTNFLELEVNVPRTIGILRDGAMQTNKESKYSQIHIHIRQDVKREQVSVAWLIKMKKAPKP